MSVDHSIDSSRCEVLATRAAAGEDAAWKALIEHLWPALRELVRRSRALGGFARSDDHVHDVLARIVERLGRDGGHALRLYAPWRAKNGDKSFADWIRIVATNEIRGYVREQLAARRDDGERAPNVKRLFNDFARSPVIDEIGVRPPMTDAQMAVQLLDFARARLPAVQYRALGLWIEGASFEEIADELALGAAKAAERTVRAAVAVLRRQFGGGAEGR